MRRASQLSFTCLAAVAAVLAAPAWAQDDAIEAQAPQAGADDEFDDTQIVVIAGSSFGQVESPAPPIDVLDSADIAAYGSNSIADLVAALAPQTGSGRGRGGGPPLFLVNGLRISNFRELRSYPPEALEKVEILPEEVAQRYGFPPDQRVLNFILKPNFASYELEGEYEQPDRGGYHRTEVEASMLKLQKTSRFNVALSAENVSPMTEATRGIVQADGGLATVPGDPDPADYRTLIADSRQFDANGSFTAALGGSGSSLSVNGNYRRNDSRSLSGLDSVVLVDGAGDSALRTFNAENPLERRTGTDAFSLGTSLNSPVGDWQFTGTLDASNSKTTSEIDRRADTAALQAAALAGTLALDAALPAPGDSGFDIARTTSNTANTKLTLSGNPLLLPGGEVNVTLDAGFDWVQLKSSDTRFAGGETQLTRGNLNGGINLGIPLTSRREMFGDWAGDITLNLSAGVDHLSDFGTLTDWSAGLTWGITEKLNLQANYVARDAAPGLGQLGNPQIETFNVPYFDISRNETVLITSISGGNPNLLQERQRDIRIGAFWQLPFSDSATLSVEYNRNRSYDVTGSLPQLTPAIEAAFADRVTRDSSGQLVSLDERAVTYASQKSSRLTVGFNFSGALGSARPQEAAPAAPGAGAPAAPAGQAARFGGAAGGAPGGPGGNFDPARFQEMRTRICGDAAAGPDKVLPEITEEQIAALPEPMQARLRGDDGKIDPEKVTALRERFCSMDGPPSFTGGAPGGPGGPGGPPPGAVAQGGPPPGAGRGAGGPPRGGPGGFGRGGNGQGRWFTNLTFTRELENQVLIAEGGPLLDQLNGQPLTGSGISRNSARFVGGMFYRGMGMRFSGNYAGPNDVYGSGLPGSTDLHFGSLATLDLRLFVNLGEQEKLVKSLPWVEGVRLALVVDNVFDTRRKVTDSNGDTPLRYQPFLLDPVGRYVGLDLRKVF